MATRTSRKGSSTSHTPVVSTPSGAARAAQRSPSPLSPARQSRLEEKRSIQNLNDRLASYIDAVRARDVEINNLKQESSTVEQTHKSEITHLKTMYTDEMNQLRKALDQVSKEKAKIEIAAEKASHEAREAKADLSNKEKLLTATDRELKSLQSKYNDALTRANNAEAELKSLRPDYAKLKDKLEDAKRNLEDETLQRIDLQNQLLSKEENLRFENQILEKQLNETRVRKQIEISEIDGRIAEKYDKKMQEAIENLRKTYEDEIAENRENFTKVYEDKLAALRQSLDNERLNTAGSVQELRDYKTRVESLSTRNYELESVNASLQKRLADLLRDMDEKAANFRAEMARKDAELRNKEEQIEATVKDYKDLMEIKIALDMEISVYRNLLEGEENRLGLSQQGSPEAGSPQGRGLKRKRTVIEEESVTEMVSDHSGKGTIVIEPVVKNSKSITVTNRSNDNVNITGWTLSNTTEGNEHSYKFPRGSTLAPEESCTIWSADSEKDHTPPSSLVMKKGGWTIGSKNKTLLVNKDGEEEACRLSSEEHRLSGSYLSGHGSLRAKAEADKSCVVM